MAKLGVIARAIKIENEIIGNLKGQFVKKTLREQIHTHTSPGLVAGNIALAYYRGRHFEQEVMINKLKQKFPEAAAYLSRKEE